MSDHVPTRPPPAGIYVPVPTFFTSSTSLDLEAQEAHAVYLAKSGIRGVVLLGSTGEAVHLTVSERASVLNSVRMALDGAGFKDYPLIAGTASQGVSETVELLKQAKECGMRWGLCLIPGYFAGQISQDGVIKWFTDVADNSPIPIMVYHYPAVSNNVKIHPSTYHAISLHPNIVGAKLSHGDVSHHLQIALSTKLTQPFHVFTGLGQQLLPVMSVGCAGAIDGSAGFFPRSLVRLFELSSLRSVNDEQAKERLELQLKVSEVEELVVKHGTAGIKAAIMKQRGIGTGLTRPPMVAMEAHDLDPWLDTLQALEETESLLASKER